MNYFQRAVRKAKTALPKKNNSSRLEPPNLDKVSSLEQERSESLRAADFFPLRPELPLPEGWTEEELFNFLFSICPEDAAKAGMESYCREDFRRFVYTWGLARDIKGAALELGANPYFTTMLLQRFTELELNLANYFGPHCEPNLKQKINFVEAGVAKQQEFESHHFNIEQDTFPFESQAFDVVFFCEIIEHLLMDPAAVIKEIKRVLKPGGALILTTPNVNRLDNVSRMVDGRNIYDPYSGHGPYGRHNREYNKHELHLLLTYLGFEISSIFTADVHDNEVDGNPNLPAYAQLLRHREHDLGQYIFVKAINVKPAGQKKPAFLYRSYLEGELE